MIDDSQGGISFAGYVTILVVIVYLGLELYGLHSARDRMEPEFVYREFVGARRAAAACPRDAQQQAAFERNFKTVTRRALAAIREQQPEATVDVIVEALAAQRATREAEVDALVAEQGCDGKDVWRLLKLHEIRSSLNLP